MRKFFSRDDFSDLESELRNARPEPRGDLLDELVSRVQPVPSRVPVRRPRIAAALVFAVVVLVALASFGGVGYATSSIKAAAKSSQHAVSSVVTKGDDKQSKSSSNSSNNNGQGGGHHPPWMYEYSPFVVICYRFQFGSHTIVVPRAFLRYLDPSRYVLGRCPR